MTTPTDETKTQETPVTRANRGNQANDRRSEKEVAQRKTNREKREELDRALSALAQADIRKRRIAEGTATEEEIEEEKEQIARDAHSASRRIQQAAAAPR